MKGSKQKGSVNTILLVITLLLLIGGGYYFYSQNKSVEPQTSTSNADSATISQNEPPIDIEKFQRQVSESANVAKLKSEKVKILANVNSFQTALNIYKEIHGKYPDVITKIIEEEILSNLNVFQDVLSVITYMPTADRKNYSINIKLPDGSHQIVTATTKVIY